MSISLKIGIIGAGSAQFSMDLVRDLCLTQGLRGSRVCFMDVDPERLEIVRRLAVRYADETGAELGFDSTTSRDSCLQDASFVINTAYAKGHEHEWKMREIGARHGYYYDGAQLGDYYQLKLSLDIARQMQSLCPDAWYVQMANPVFNCTTLVSRETDLRIVGLCHGHHGVRNIARTIVLDPSRITFQAPGFNHNIWLTHFALDGEDAYPLLDEWIRAKAEAYWESHVPENTHDCGMSRAAVHLYRMYGLFPVGDTLRRVGGGPNVGCTVHRGEWWLHTDFETKKHWFGKPWGGPDTVEARRWFDRQLKERVAGYAKLAADPKARLAEELGSGRSDEQIIPIIDCLLNGKAGTYQVNFPNRGAVDGIPADVAVEVPAVVNDKGIQPIHIGALPPKVLIECLLPHWVDMERNLLAFKTGDRSILLWNVLDGHQTRSLEQAQAVLEELLAMPGHEEMARHFRYPAGWPQTGNA